MYIYLPDESIKYDRLKSLSREFLLYPLFNLRSNAKYSIPELLNPLITASTRNRSLENICSSPYFPSADDILLHVKDKVNLENTERMQFFFLSKRDIKLLRRKYPSLKITIAMDFTPEPFYGDKHSENITGYERKRGTNYCFKFFTVSLVIKGVKFFVWAYPAYKGTDRIWLINRGLEVLESLEIKPDIVLMDREFYEVHVLALLREKKMHYIIPAKKDSHFKKYLAEIKKFPALVKDYEIENKYKETEKTNLIILEEINNKGKRMIYGYITNLPRKFYENDVYILSKIYRKRWNIETSHRVHDNFRIKTTCKEGNVRYLFFVIGVLLYNLWIYINLLLNLCAGNTKYKIFIKSDEMKDMVFEFFRDMKFMIGMAM